MGVMLDKLLTNSKAACISVTWLYGRHAVYSVTLQAGWALDRRHEFNAPTLLAVKRGLQMAKPCRCRECAAILGGEPYNG